MKNTSLLIRLLLVLVLFAATGRAQDATQTPAPTPAPAQSPAPSQTPSPTPAPSPHVDGMLGHLELDDIVELHIENLEKWAETHDVNKLVPYINGRSIKGNYPDELHLERGRVIFHLQITPESKDAWTDLLGEPSATRRPVSLSAGLENGSAFDTIYGKDNTVPLTVISPVYGIVAVGVILVTLFLLLWLARHTNIIREPGPPAVSGKRRPYNLGRAQMAFWFFLIYASYTTIWLITNALDTITSSLLALMGISAGTALGEALIDNGKDTSKTNSIIELTSEKQAIEQTVAQLQVQVDSINVL